ncbi:MAG: TatD family hydrolase [Thaumarchaeota archaeon]|nr:TatD family hydrolase [Nitrososphaerota archaeon]
MLHWFSGNEYQLKKILNSEILVSFGPALVYSKSLQKLAKLSNPESTIVETDGPVTFSACYEGKIAEPSFIPSIVNKLSNLWSIQFDDILEQISNNLKKYIVVRSQ